MIEDKSLQNYLKEIAKYPLLSREEEVSLAKKVQAGDSLAKEKLINCNLKFVVKIAAKYQNRGLSLSELISEGNLGLIKAISKFDHTKDIKLISYAVWWIKQSIVTALKEKTPLIRVPISVSQKAVKIKQAKTKYQVITGKTDPQHILEDNTVHTLPNTVYAENIDYFTTKEESDHSDIFHSLQNPEQSMHQKALLQKTINNSLKTLNEREALIIKLYFGLDGQKEMTFREIAQVVGISRERVRQLQKIGLKKILKKIYTDKNDIPFYE